MAQAIEMVRFTVKPGEEEALVAERSGMLEALTAEYPGLVSARLARADETTWLDLIVWESRERALAAAEGAPRIPACAAWFGHFAEVLGMEHADVVAAAR
jgi:heme-degrading monooxygenase HmoA